MTLYTHGNTVQYKVGGEHYLGQGGGVEYVPVSGYEGGLLVEGYQPAQAWPAHNLLAIDEGFDPSECRALQRSMLLVCHVPPANERVPQAWRAWAR